MKAYNKSLSDTERNHIPGEFKEHAPRDVFSQNKKEQLISRWIILPGCWTH